MIKRIVAPVGGRAAREAATVRCPVCAIPTWATTSTRPDDGWLAKTGKPPVPRQIRSSFSKAVLCFSTLLLSSLDSPQEEDGFEPSAPLRGYPVSFAKDPLRPPCVSCQNLVPRRASARRVRRRLDDQLRYGRTPEPQGMLGPDPLQF